MKFILGKKLGMTTIYDKEQGALNVTLIQCEENKISCVRTLEKDGYTAVQLELAKTKNKSKKKEFRVETVDGVNVGDAVSLSAFGLGDVVKISGISKGKGFQGVVKRHGFKGAPATHGHKHDLRAPGSIGAQQPQHVIKGKRMAGHMGGERSSVKNLKVVFLDQERKIMGVKGAVPGVHGRIVEVVSL